MTPTSAPKPSGARRDRTRTSVGQVFAAVAGFVALAAIGAAIGWGVTKAPTKPVSDGHSASPSPSPGTPSSPAGPSSPSPSASGTTFTIPDYNLLGTTFQAARDELRSHGLGVTLIFKATGSPASLVLSTSPAAGVTVGHGVTVNVYVDGTPPLLAVPALPTPPPTCGSWGKTLAADGFIPAYSPSNGKSLLVAAETPGPDDPTTVWNQKITLTCTADGQLPQPPSTPPSAPASTPDSPATTP